MEGGIIHDHHMRVIQKGAKLGFQPSIEDGRVARAVKQDRGGTMVADPGSKQGGPWSAVARGQAVHPLPPLGIRVPPDNRRFKATFIEVDQHLAPADVALTQAQIPLAFPQATLGVPQRFFSSHAHLPQGMPDTMPGHPKVAGPLFLGPIRLLPHVRPQRLPIQAAGMPRPGALVGQPVRGIEPVIDTGPGDLKPAGGRRLAAAAPHIIE